MTVPEPSDPFEPAWETLPAGSLLLRVHEPVLSDGSANDGTLFNPGYGESGRWSFFGDPSVPVHYSAADPEAAVHETLLHDAVPGGHLSRATWETTVLTVLRTVRDLELVQFHSEGLRLLNLHARDLTDTDADEYGRTVRWGEAAHRKGADGVVWMSRQLNTARAYCLFGGRPGETRSGAEDLVVEPGHPAARVFATPDDTEWLSAVAMRMDVSTKPV